MLARQRSTIGWTSRLAGEIPQDSFVPIRGWDKVPTLPLLKCVAPFKEEGPLCIEDIEEYAQDSIEFAERYLRKHRGHALRAARDVCAVWIQCS